MDQRRRPLSFSIDEPVSTSAEPHVLPTSGLSDDEAFEALAASMSMFEPIAASDVQCRDEVAEPINQHLTPDSFGMLEVEHAEVEYVEVEETPDEGRGPEGTEVADWNERPLPAALTGLVIDDLPELRPFDGGSAVAHSGQGWLDPMAFTRDAAIGHSSGSFGTRQPGRIEPPGSSRPQDRGHADEDLGVFQRPGIAELGDSFDDIVMLGLFTGEISTDLIAAAQATECASAVSSAENADPQSDGYWSRPTTLDELSAVVETYLQPVVAVSAGLVQKPGLVDDVVAKTFLSAWVEGREGTPSEPMESWLYSICLETVRRKERHHQRHGAVANTRYPAPAHRGSEEVRQANARAVWEICLALGELDDLERNVLQLSHHGGLLHDEIAAETHSSLGAVKSCLYRASNHMVNRLSHRLDDESSSTRLDTVGPVDLVPSDNDDGLADFTIEDGRADHTWYLAGVADGSGLSPLDRRVIKDIRVQLATEYVWAHTTPGMADAILAAAADNEGTLVIRSRGGGSPSPASQVPAGGEQPLEAATPQVGGLARTTVQYSPELAKGRSSRLRRVVHPLKGTTASGQENRPRHTGGATDVRKIRRSPEAATAPVPIQPGPQAQDLQQGDRTAPGTEGAAPKAGLVSHGRVAALAIGVIVLAAAIILAPYVLGSGPVESDSLDFELRATAADPDATAVVTVSQLGTETMYRMWLGGLNPTGDQDFYAAWLVDPATVSNGAVSLAEAQVLGSFRWTVNGEPIVLAIDGVEPRFDQLIVTLQGPNNPPGPSGVVVLEGNVRKPGS